MAVMNPGRENRTVEYRHSPKPTLSSVHESETILAEKSVIIPIFPLTNRKGAEVPGLKVGIQLACLGLPFRRALVAAAKLGATAVEIDARGEINAQAISTTGMRDLKRILGDHGLQVSAVGFRTRRGYDDPQEIDRRVTATKVVMKFAQGIGAANVVNHVGFITSDEQSASWKLLIEVLTDLSLYGHQVGARLCADTGNESPEDLKRLLDALPQYGIGVNLNPGRLIIAGFPPLDAVDKLGENILHVHATDGVQDRARGRGMEVQLGRGSADYPSLAASLETIGYHGYFTVAKENTESSEEELSAAIKYLKNI
jgi:sugar phosphate isomerase/epimerase